MFENPRRGRQARNFTTNVPKILVLKSSSEQIFSRKLPLGAPEIDFHSSSTGAKRKREEGGYSLSTIRRWCSKFISKNSHKNDLGWNCALIEPRRSENFKFVFGFQHHWLKSSGDVWNH